MKNHVIDQEKWNEFIVLGDGQVNFAKELLDTYLTNSTKLLTTIQGALSNENHQDIYNGVHTLKGSALNIGAVYMSKILIKLEKEVAQRNFSNITTAIKTLEQHLQEIKTFRKKL